MASPNEENEKEAEDEEFVDYHVTEEEEVRQASLEMREPGNASYQKHHDTAMTDSEAVMKQFKNGEITELEVQRRLLHHKIKFQLHVVRSMEIRYEIHKRGVKSMPLYDEISKRRRQAFIEDMRKLKEAIKEGRKQVQLWEEELRKLTHIS